MTKTIHTVKTLITEDDFIKLKEVEPFASMRQDAKSCFPGDTKVIIEGVGEVELNRLVPEIDSGLAVPHLQNLRALTPTGFQPIEATVYGSTDYWIEIITETGDVVRMTPDHPCVVVRDGMKIVVQAEFVQDSDKLLSL